MARSAIATTTTSPATSPGIAQLRVPRAIVAADGELGVVVDEEDTATEEVVESDVAERKEMIDEDVDAILDEIDEVLETNAEDFVKSFIQKGGE